MTIQEEATRIVAERIRQYNALVADLYSMAAQAGDREMQQEIWDEAWTTNNLPLLALLLLTEIPFFETESERPFNM